MNLAPVVVFAFNRPDLLKNTLASLKANVLFDQTDLFIFIDGPKTGSDSLKIEQVKQIIEDLNGCKSKKVYVSEQNKGLANSVISGVTTVFNRYNKVIVVEDDLHLSPSFLTFMNQMLDRYEKEDKVFQVTGFGVKIKPPRNYSYDTYFHTRAQSWTWGTWRDRWESIDWNVADYGSLCKDKAKQKSFNKGGSDLFKMLRNYMEGRNNSWYIRFTYAMFEQGKFSLAPIRSLAINNGFIKESTHCNAYNRYKTDFLNHYQAFFSMPDKVEINNSINKQVYSYWSIPYRIYAKIVTIVIKLFN